MANQQQTTQQTTHQQSITTTTNQPPGTMLAADGGGGGGDEGQIFDADLAAIDFSAILGGPMTAAINAQAQSAMVTLEFINSVGFQSSGGEGGGATLKANEVDFTYSKSIPAKDGTVSQQTSSLTVPILSIVPIPFIRVQQLSVDLNVKLNSVQKASTSNSIVTNTTVGSNGFLSLFSPVKFATTIVSKNDSRTSSTITESYDLSVKMLAVQDQMPGGLAKVLQILQDSMDGGAAATPKS
jgi:Protein of unknown function (DUF2589)